MASRWAYDVSLPFRFLEDCDLVMEENEAVIDQSLYMLTYTYEASIPLTPTLGSKTMMINFELLDNATEIILDTSLRTAIEEQEPRVHLDKEFLFDESTDGSALYVVVPYKIKVTGEDSATKLVFNR